MRKRLNFLNLSYSEKYQLKNVNSHFIGGTYNQVKENFSECKSNSFYKVIGLELDTVKERQIPESNQTKIISTMMKIKVLSPKVCYTFHNNNTYIQNNKKDTIINKKQIYSEHYTSPTLLNTNIKNSKINDYFSKRHKISMKKIEKIKKESYTNEIHYMQSKPQINSNSRNMAVKYSNSNILVRLTNINSSKKQNDIDHLQKLQYIKPKPQVFININ